MKRSMLLLICGLTIWGSSVATAHKFAPSLLKIIELPSAGGRQLLHVMWKTPIESISSIMLRPYWPETCDVRRQSPPQVEGTATVIIWDLDCGVENLSLSGQSIGISGLAENQVSAVALVNLRDGRSYQQVLSSERASFVVPLKSEVFSVLVDYLSLGVEHILTGPDHLLFVFGLLLLLTTKARLIGTITAFTFGHSITLSFVALGFFDYPVALVEFLIAFSLFLLAIELARRDEGGKLWQNPWWLAGAFGLLHGMGFAGALLEIGLPQENIFFSLLSFNVGIELGQIIFVVFALSIWRIAKTNVGLHYERLHTAAVYAMGGLSIMWCIERGEEWLHFIPF